MNYLYKLRFHFDIGKILQNYKWIRPLVFAGTQYNIGFWCYGNVISDNSAGPGRVPDEVLKLTVQKRPELLISLYNTCFRKGNFSRQWKRQKRVLIPKGKGRDPKLTSLYKPLGMLDTAEKLCKDNP